MDISTINKCGAKFKKNKCGASQGYFYDSMHQSMQRSVGLHLFGEKKRAKILFTCYKCRIFLVMQYAPNIQMNLRDTPSPAIRFPFPSIK